MANVTLKNIKKIYPNADTKKKKKKKEHTSDEPKANLQITDEGVVAVQEFSLDIADREFIVLVGPSGCGKSTTLRMIAGLEEITDGELYIGDRLVNDVAPKDRDIAMVFQNYALYPHMTVYENMAFSLKLKKVPKQEIDKKVREAAEILGITEYLDRKPKALSGGQRQRVAIGRAIVRNPQVLLMDEPLSNLDAKLRNQMRAEIIKLRSRINTTFVYVTHDQTEAMTLGDRIVIMRDGFIQQIGTPQEVFNHPKNLFVAGFIGTPQMNFFPDAKLTVKDGKYVVELLGKSINLGETKYDFSKMYSVDGGESSLGIDSEYVVYLDANGYAIYVEETEYNIADYAYLRALQGSSVAFASDKAALITYDGKMKTVDTKEDYTNDFAGYGSELQIGDPKSEIVLVKETSKGEYRLKDLDTKNPSIAKAEDSFELRNGVARINLTNKGVTNASDAKQGTDYIYADSKTVFVVGTYDSGARENWKNATYRAYTGINNAPTIVDDNDSSPATNAIGMSYYCRNNGVATIVYLSVDEADYKVTGGNNDVIFFAFESGSKKIEDSDNEYYTYNAVVDGKIVEGVKVDASVKINNRTSNGSFSSNVVFTGADYDDGVITGLDSLSNSGTVTGINKVNNENVVLGYGNGSESTYVVADDAKIFFIDDDGTITEGAVSNIRRSDEDVVTYVLEDGQISYLFVQQYFEDNDQSSSGGRQELTSITGVTYSAPNLTLTLNGTNAGQNYKVTLKMIVAGVTTELGTYTVTGATGATSTTAVLSVGTLASIAASGGIYMVSCGGQNATFTA